MLSSSEAFTGSFGENKDRNNGTTALTISRGGTLTT